MTFSESISTCLTKYADFTGRATRPEYWWFVLASLIASSLAQAVFGYGIGLLVSLGLFLPQLAAGVRRLHDTGRSGAYYFILLIPLVGAVLLLIWLATEGEPGSNQYGPVPA